MTCTNRNRNPKARWQSSCVSGPTKPYIHPYLGGALLGVVLFTAFFLTGNGLGASGGLNRIIGLRSRT